MLILLTLSFLQTNNRTSNSSDIGRNVSNLLSKKQFDPPPHITEKGDNEAMDTGRPEEPGVLARTSLAPGDILNGDVLFTKQPKKDPYILTLTKLMEARNTGYLSMAFEELCEILSFKKPDDLHSIVKHTDSVIEELSYKMSRFQWMGEPMSTILRDVAMIVSEEPIDEMQTRAMILKSLMRYRHNIVGADVNVALDLADNLINKEDGEHLFGVIHELKMFPNITKTGKEICKEVIEAFESPFRHISSSWPLQRMVKIGNRAFIDRFPRYSNVRVSKVKRRPASSPDPATSEHTTRSHSNLKRPHNLKHRQKTPTHSTLKPPHKNTQTYKTKRPYKKLQTKRRKHKPIRPNILLR